MKRVALGMVLGVVSVLALGAANPTGEPGRAYTLNTFWIGKATYAIAKHAESGAKAQWTQAYWMRRQALAMESACNGEPVQ